MSNKDIVSGYSNMLKEVVGCDLSDCIKCQLREIFNQTEKVWEDNLKLYHSDSEIKFLLICEAPPWTFCSTARYFYLQPQGPLFSTICKAFYGGIPKNRNKIYDCLRRDGFLLIDSLPFAFPYTSNQRRSQAYQNMVKAFIPWWVGKLNSSGLKFSKDLKIAFGYYWNGKQVIKALGGKLVLGSTVYPVDNNQIISHKGSRYLPDYMKLQKVVNIKGSFNCP